MDGSPVLGAQGISLLLRQDGTDTWVMDTDAFTQPVIEMFSSEREQWVVDEAGPLRARIRLDGSLGHSRVRWTLSLAHDTPCVNISLDVLFSEHLALLQMPVHLAEAPRTWRDGQAMGAVERQRDAQGRPVEWPVQRWSKMILAHGHEIALVTNDAFSVSLDADNRWQWTLLRSPRAASVSDGWGRDVFLPGRDLYTDQGEHHFDFQLQVGHGELSDVVLDRSARQQAQSPIVFDRYEGLNRPPWGAVPPLHLQKPLETNLE